MIVEVIQEQLVQVLQEQPIVDGWTADSKNNCWSHKNIYTVFRDVQEQLIAYLIQERQIIKVPKELLMCNILQEQMIVKRIQK
jgi:hypothetical protein